MTRINVLQKDIDMGEAKDCAWCPIGLAILREFPNLPPDLLAVGIGPITAKPEIKFVSRYFIMYPDSIAFMREFDSGQEVQPRKFELDWSENAFLSREELGAQRCSE